MQKRITRRIISNSAHYDFKLSVAISQLLRIDVLWSMLISLSSAGSAFALANSDPVQIGLIPYVVKVEVLCDSRGSWEFSPVKVMKN